MKFTSLWQKCFPQHTLSRCLGALAEKRRQRLKNWVIRRFIHHYHVDMSEALESNYRHYANFNDFFTRALKPNVRPLPVDSQSVACPVDGSISEFGQICMDQLLQAKGIEYDLAGLLGGDPVLTKQFWNGSFFTVYLAPKDYHRVHMPLMGKLQQMIYVPGELFSVNEASVANIPHLFSRNERIICIFDTTAGSMAVIMVGAMIVGSISTVWHGIVKPYKVREIRHWDYVQHQVVLERGQEMGHFRLGSTVIILFVKDAMQWDSALFAGQEVRMGQTLGKWQYPQQVLIK